MKENKEVKISLKTAVLLSIIVLILIAIIIVVIFKFAKNDINNNENNIQNPIKNPITTSENYKKVSINGKTYYQRLNDSTWSGEYNKQDFYTSMETLHGDNINIMEVVSYTKYLEIINSINSIQDKDYTDSKEIQNYYTNENCNYIVLSYSNGSSWCGMQLIDCREENNKIIIYGNENQNGVMASGSGYFIAIPTNMPVGTEVEYRQCYTSSEIENLKDHGTTTGKNEIVMDDKPIIYLYPEQEIQAQVKLGYPNALTCSYPLYPQEGWNVIANPDGNLQDLKSGKNLYSLYYESKAMYNFKVENDGFIVKSNEVAEFLEEKLEILGLTQREAEEFIIYWLPKLQENEYNYIRFASEEEINKNMPLKINPKPDTLIRVLMTYKRLESPIQVKEQKLTTPERTGFVAVEWGGTEIKY